MASGRSYDSWNTQDINEHRARQSYASKWGLALAIFLNVSLNLIELAIVLTASSKGITWNPENNHLRKFGFTCIDDMYYSSIVIYLVLYAAMMVMFLAILLRLVILFTKAYPDLYEDIKFKLISLLAFYVIFLTSRTYFFYYA